MMTKSRSVALAIAFFAACLLFLAPAAAEPLPSDSRILTGKLDNGVTWMYRKHDNPPGKMALMMHVDTGSLNETDAQRGLAHFMEHMVFNGTEHFAPGELIPFFESIGMEFGPDINAGTSFDFTQYMVFLPSTELEQLDKGLTVLSDYAFRALLTEEEIENERGVILEEKRSRKSAAQRIRDTLWPELFAGSRFAERLPIGAEEVIAKAPRSEFADYYRTWYRPENVTVMLVGDADHEPIIPLVKKWFGEYKAPVPPRKPLGADFKTFTEQRAMVVTDPEVTSCEVEMTNIRPGRPPTLTVEQYRRDLVEGLADWMLSRRCDERVKKGEASYREAGTSVDDFFHEALSISGSATGEPADWAKMLEELITEVSRAREFGFTDKELAQVKKQLVASAERAVRTEPTRNARRLIREMSRSVTDEEPILSAAQELDLLTKLLPTVTAAEISQTFKDHFVPGAFAYVVTLPEKDGVAVPAKDDVLATARSAWARNVEARKVDDTPDGLLPTLPTPGKVIESTLDKDLAITDAWLENGIRVHHRFMDYKKDTVMLSIAFAGGAIEETAENLAVTYVAGLAVNNAATSRLSSTAIRDMKLGKNIRVGADPRTDDAFALRMSGSPKDLEFGLQLAYALITDGKIEATAFKNWKLKTLQAIEKSETSVTAKAQDALGDLLSGGDPRHRQVQKENVEVLSVAKGQAWFERLCREAPIEVAVVGDITWEQAKPLIEQYVGSLPQRSRSADHLDKLRALARSTGPLARKVDVETVTPTAVAYAGFVSCEGSNVADRRALNLAENILTSRLTKRIREEAALVYSIGAQNTSAWIYRDSGRFQAGSKCKPENADRVADEVHKIFAAFAESGPTAEEMENARKQVLEDLDTDMKEPSYWASLLRNFALRGRNLDDSKSLKEKYAAITAEQVQTAFKKYYTPERMYRVTAVPVAPAEQTKPQVEQQKKKAADVPAA